MAAIKSVVWPFNQEHDFNGQRIKILGRHGVYNPSLIMIYQVYKGPRFMWCPTIGDSNSLFSTVQTTFDWWKIQCFPMFSMFSPCFCYIPWPSRIIWGFFIKTRIGWRDDEWPQNCVRNQADMVLCPKNLCRESSDFWWWFYVKLKIFFHHWKGASPCRAEMKCACFNVFPFSLFSHLIQLLLIRSWLIYGAASV